MIIFRICNFFYQQNCCFLKNKTASPIYLFEDSGILVGFTYNDVVPECYIITMDGLESEPFADLDGSERVEVQHISEAIGYRNLDRGDWAERRMY